MSNSAPRRYPPAALTAARLAACNGLVRRCACKDQLPYLPPPTRPNNGNRTLTRSPPSRSDPRASRWVPRVNFASFRIAALVPQFPPCSPSLRAPSVSRNVGTFSINISPIRQPTFKTHKEITAARVRLTASPLQGTSMWLRRNNLFQPPTKETHSTEGGNAYTSTCNPIWTL